MASLIKQSLRQLILRPFLSVTVIAMLALGIGAATAIFSLFHQVLVQPLPVPAPERLVNIAIAGSEPLSRRETLSYPMFRDLEAGQEVFTGIAAHTPSEVNIGPTKAHSELTRCSSPAATSTCSACNPRSAG